MKTLKQLLDTLPQQGEVSWIGVRPQRKAAMISLREVFASSETGLDGDRYQGQTGKRHVTLLQEEHLAVIMSCSESKLVKPEDLRRNIVVCGINLLALKNRVIEIGSAQLEVTGLCHPCSRMETNLGAGGYNAMRGHGGITARILSDGTIKVGDLVRTVPPDENTEIVLPLP